MLLTNGEIFQGAQALAKLSAMEFPVKTSYGILRVMRQIKDQADVINETREGLIKRYGTPKDGGQTGIQPGDDNWESFVAEFNELMKMTVTHTEEFRIVTASQLIRDYEMQLQIAAATGRTENEVQHIERDIIEARTYRQCLIERKPNCQHLKPPE